ncbi:MAG: glutaredoxin [Candidatus Roizmanbacteria bacterium]
MRTSLYRYLAVFLCVVIGLLISTHSPVFADEGVATSPTTSPVRILTFVRDGCAHCAALDEYLNELKNTRSDFVVESYNLGNTTQKDVWDQFTASKKLSKVTPITIVGAQYIVGFDTAQTTGAVIRDLIDQAVKKGQSYDLLHAQPLGTSQNACDESGLTPCAVNAKPSQLVTLPLIGTISSSSYPLFILAAILGFFDGFNPCAMWVLVSFLAILSQVGDRRRMLLFAGTFIVAEAVMYYLILTVWFQTWDFVQLDRFVTPTVGLVSIVGGLLFLREWRKKELACKVASPQERSKTVQKIKHLATRPFTIITFLGILGVAFSVNIIEFACSVGIPQAFTKILEINHVGFLKSQFFISIYILMYMIDDFIVFAFALYSFDKLSHTNKYARISNLVGGIVLVLLGLLLILKPGALQF